MAAGTIDESFCVTRARGGTLSAEGEKLILALLAPNQFKQGENK
jgi:hypothetical protein